MQCAGGVRIRIYAHKNEQGPPNYLSVNNVYLCHPPPLAQYIKTPAFKNCRTRVESANLFLAHALNTVDTRLRGYDAPDQNLYLKKCTVVCIIYNMKTGGYVYILASGPMGTLYIGSTTDLVGRIWQHKHKSIKGFTSRYDIDKLVYYEWHDRLENMVLRERQLKKWNRNWKCRLIIQQNPLWQDLYNDVLSGAGYSTE